jgi:hypothetical protein
MQENDDYKKETLEFTAAPGANRHWYNLFAPLSVALFFFAISGVSVFLWKDASVYAKISGGLLIFLSLVYCGYYFYHYFRSLKLYTRKAVLTDEYLEVANRLGTKRLRLDALDFTMSYSSSRIMCIAAACKDDYLMVICPCSYLFSKGSSEYLTPFYAMNKRFMALNQNHVNYIRNKRYRRKFPFKVPQYVFEIEFDTERAVKFIRSARMAAGLRGHEED